MTYMKMQNVLLISMSFFFLNSSTFGEGGKFALLFGVEDYHYLPDLNGCNKDVREFGKVLKGMGFQVEEVTGNRAKPSTLPTVELINKQLAKYIGYRNPDTHSYTLGNMENGDVLLIAFSGHGVQIDGEYYLCPYDAQAVPDGSKVEVDSLIKMADIEDCLNQCCVKTIIVADTCKNRHADLVAEFRRSQRERPNTLASRQNDRSTSGSNKRRTGVLPPLEADKPRTLSPSAFPQWVRIESCSDGQTARSSPHYNMGYFTHHFVESLKLEKSKRSVPELFTRVKYAVRTDTLKNDEGAQLALATWSPQLKRDVRKQNQFFDFPLYEEHVMPSEVVRSVHLQQQNGINHIGKTFENITFEGPFNGFIFQKATFNNCTFNRCSFRGGIMTNAKFIGCRSLNSSFDMVGTREIIIRDGFKVEGALPFPDNQKPRDYDRERE